MYYRVVVVSGDHDLGPSLVLGHSAKGKLHGTVGQSGGGLSEK